MFDAIESKQTTLIEDIIDFFNFYENALSVVKKTWHVPKLALF